MRNRASTVALLFVFAACSSEESGGGSGSGGTFATGGGGASGMSGSSGASGSGGGAGAGQGGSGGVSGSGGVPSGGTAGTGGTGGTSSGGIGGTPSGGTGGGSGGLGGTSTGGAGGTGGKGGTGGTGGTSTGGTGNVGGAGGSGGSTGGTGGGSGGTTNCPQPLTLPSAPSDDCYTVPSLSAAFCPAGCSTPTNAYQCAKAGSPTPATGCVFVYNGVTNFVFCCPPACVRRSSYDSICIGYGKPSKARSCHSGATPPSGCQSLGLSTAPDVYCCSS